MIAVTDTEFVWLHNPDTGGTAQFAIGAVGAWTARGWEPCDPPAEVDPTRAHAADAEIPPVEPAPSDSAPEVDVDPKTTKKSGGSGISTEGK